MVWMRDGCRGGMVGVIWMKDRTLVMLVVCIGTFPSDPCADAEPAAPLSLRCFLALSLITDVSPFCSFHFSHATDEQLVL